MALPAFPLTTPLADSDQETTTVKTLLAAFGDDYEQEALDGINPFKGEGGWTFLGTHAEIQSAVSFLETNCVSGFTFQPPHRAAAGAYKCRSWKDTYLTGDEAMLACQFTSFSEP